MELANRNEVALTICDTVCYIFMTMIVVTLEILTVLMMEELFVSEGSKSVGQVSQYLGHHSVRTLAGENIALSFITESMEE